MTAWQFHAPARRSEMLLPTGRSDLEVALRAAAKRVASSPCLKGFSSKTQSLGRLTGAPLSVRAYPEMRMILRSARSSRAMWASSMPVTPCGMTTSVQQIDLAVTFQERACREAVGRRENDIAELLQRHLDDLPDIRLVLDEKNRLALSAYLLCV